MFSLTSLFSAIDGFLEKVIRDLNVLRTRLYEAARMRLVFREMISALAVHRMLFDSRGEPIDYIFLDVNPAFERMTGLSRRRVLNRRVMNILPGLEQRWIEMYGQVVKTGESIFFEEFSGALGRHYTGVAFRLRRDEFAVSFYDVSQVHHLQRQIIGAYDDTLRGWAHLLELRSQHTAGHAERVTTWTLRFARLAGINIEMLPHIRRGAYLHDIGKMIVPDQILSKPGPLTDDEMALMRQHPVMAFNLLGTVEYLKPALDIPYCHHERWDGTGYPRGLRGKDIPLAARLFAILDVYDAITSPRPYRPTVLSPEEALAYIREKSGSWFDPDLVALFNDHHAEILAG